VKKPEIKALLSDALSQSETADPGEVFNLLMAASKHSDAALGAAVRRQFSVIGLCLLALSWGVDSRMNRTKRGRPRAVLLKDVDCQRAFSAWGAARLTGKRQMSNLDAIEICRELDDIKKTPKVDQLFCALSQNSMEQSMSRSRTKLEMSNDPNDRWQSAHCEAMFSMRSLASGLL